MIMSKKIFFIFVLSAVSLFFQGDFSNSFPNPDESNSIDFTNPFIEKKIDSILSKMTLKEKIGQLIQIVGEPKNLDSLIKEGSVGSILIGTGVPGEINRLQKIAINSRLKIPLIFAHDVIHGYYTIYPIPLGETASWNIDIVKQDAHLAAMEAASQGTKWTFAPMVDIARDPRWGRITEGSGEDPYLGCLMAEARVKGFQGNNLSDPFSITACAKHYVAYGGAEGGRDYNTVDISERTLREIYLPPFKSAVDAGAATIMSAFNDLNGIPASANYHNLTEILKDEWGFKGLVISDYNSIGELIFHEIAKNKYEAAKEGFSAGVDVDMVGDTVVGNIYLPNLGKLVNDGSITLNKIDESVKRVLRVKLKMGLFEHPYVDTMYYEENLISKEERESIVRNSARESIVLLKNQNKILPIKKDIGSIALIGPLADNQSDPLGAWSAAGQPENIITVLKGISNKISSNTKINYVKGCEINDSSETDFDKAVEAAKKSDIVIMVVGESREMSGEAASRSNLNLPGVQKNLVKRIYQTGKPVVVVLMNGRPLTINWVAKNIPAVIEAWFLGDQAGNAIADVLFGDYNPSGKLPVTFPRSVGQIPIYYNHKNTGRPAKENDKYTSKYLDSPVSPLYPFGYGLSYTTFDYMNIRTDKSKISKSDSLAVLIDVSNAGSIAGEEVVQLYIHDEVRSVTPAVKELKGFKKIKLSPGETKTIKFIITPQMLSFLDVHLNRIVEPGTFDIMIGGNSVDVLTTSFEVTK
jgi:beta-glucosidase